MWSPESHLLELDGVRGFAILIVTIYRFAKQVPTDQFTGYVAEKFIIAGERGVDLFFVLSGFLITGILLDTRERTHFFRNFFVRRTLRIFPLYFATLFGLLVLLPALLPQSDLFQPAREQQFYLWTYLTNVRIAMEGRWCFGYLDHFWSLAVEEHFYLMWPVVVWALGRQRTFWFALLFAFACAISRVSFAAFSTNGVAPDVMSFFRFDGLLLGAAIACLIRSPGIRNSITKPAVTICVICALLILVLEIKTGRLLTVSHTVWAIFWASLLVILLESPRTTWLAKFFRTRLLCSLGKYSYAMYVFQSPLIPVTGWLVSTAGIAVFLGLDQRSVVPTLIYTAIMFALTYATAVCSWHLFEKHLLKLKRYF